MRLWARGVLAVGGVLASVQETQAQTPTPANVKANVPVRELSAPEAKSAEHFGTILNLRPLANGGLLINDGQKRQLVTLDAMLGHRTVVVDSVSVGGQSYGATAAPLIPYLGDSSLFVDNASLSLLVIDPAGKIVRVMAAAKPGDLRSLGSSASGVDANGNLVYRVMAPPKIVSTADVVQTHVTPPDSASIMRANFDSRRVDTIARIKVSAGAHAEMKTEGGRTTTTITVNPLFTIDEWAILSDGTVAIVRGHDYHVETLNRDGTFNAGPRLPFDWKQLDDADKQHLIDSTRTAIQQRDVEVKGGNVPAPIAAPPPAAAPPPGTFVAIGIPPASNGAVTSFERKTEFVPLKDIPDYWPPIRTGAARADLDAHLWILPTTSAQSKSGELVYDVVSNRGVLVQRVRIPTGRSIAGFGHNGIVYLMVRDAEGWMLERTRVVGGK